MRRQADDALPAAKTPAAHLMGDEADEMNEADATTVRAPAVPPGRHVELTAAQAGDEHDPR